MMDKSETGFAERIGKRLLPLRSYFFPVFFLVFLFWRGWGYHDGYIYMYWPAGAVLIAGGVWFRLWGIRNIGGKAHTRKGKRLKKLVTTGPFSITRNPLYIANIVIFTGYAVLSKAWVCIIPALFLTWLMYHFIVLHEERLLERSFGEKYVEYGKRVPRWWIKPGILKANGEDARTWKRVFELETGGIIASVVALGLMALKEFVRISFNWYWGTGIMGGFILYVLVHNLRRYYKKKRKNLPGSADIST